MKFSLNKGLTKENIYNLMRKIGYRFQETNDSNSELIFIKPLTGNDYPRFHVYLKVEDKNLIFNLHLDQKKPTYEGSPAHAGEYEGEIVEKELERIKENLIK